MWYTDRWGFISWCRHERRKLKAWEPIIQQRRDNHQLKLCAIERLSVRGVSCKPSYVKKMREKKFNNSAALGGNLTLIEEVRRALKKFKNMSIQDLKDYDFSHGHCITNSY